MPKPELVKCVRQRGEDEKIQSTIALLVGSRVAVVMILTVIVLKSMLQALKGIPDSQGLACRRRFRGFFQGCRQLFSCTWDYSTYFSSN